MTEVTFTETLVQTENPPFDSLKTAQEFTTTIQDFITWDTVGLLIDESGQNLVILLLENDAVISSLRANLYETDLLQFILELSNKQTKNYSACLARSYNKLFSFKRFKNLSIFGIIKALIKLQNLLK